MSVEAFKKSRARFLEETFKQPAYQQAKASGRFENFLKSEESATITPDRWVQRGPNYTPYIDVGSGRITKRTDGTLFASLYEWVGRKKYGITYANDRQRRGIVFGMIANRTKEQGIAGSFKRRNPNKRTAIIQTAIEKTVPYMLAEIGKDTTTFVASQVQEEISNINRQS